MEDILDGVAALVDKSLIVMEPGEGVARYRLLETVRQYGAERRGEAGESGAVELRFAEHYLSIVEAVAPLIVGGPIGLDCSSGCPTSMTTFEPPRRGRATTRRASSSRYGSSAGLAGSGMRQVSSAKLDRLRTAR